MLVLEQAGAIGASQLKTGGPMINDAMDSRPKTSGTVMYDASYSNIFNDWRLLYGKQFDNFNEQSTLTIVSHDAPFTGCMLHVHGIMLYSAVFPPTTEHTIVFDTDSYWVNRLLHPVCRSREIYIKLTSSGSLTARRLSVYPDIRDYDSPRPDQRMVRVLEN
jgi:hypothetical protein